MFEVGFTEIVLILGLALLVLGPEKLPGLAQKVGRWTGRARSMARQLRTQLEQEVTLEELAKSRPMQPNPSASSTSHDAQPEHRTGPQEPHREPSAQADDTPVHPDPEPDLHQPTSGTEPAADAHPADAEATITKSGQ